MRKLRTPVGAIPRGFADHRRGDGRKYTEYCRAIQAQWGPLPAVALPVLREAGRAEVELEHLALRLEVAKGRRRVREAARIRRQQFALREQVARLEDRIKTLAASVSKESDPLAGVRRAVEEANR